MRRIVVAFIACVLAFGMSACAIGSQDESQPEANPSEEVAAKDEAEESAKESNEEPPKEVLHKKPLQDYTWDELSQISALIVAEENPEAQREVAKSFGLVDDDGAITRQTKQIIIDDTRALDVRLIGICHDDKADGSGKVGLTFMTVGALGIFPMNDEVTINGGWEKSTLRARLAGEQKARLEPDLSSKLVAVNKLTNNVGLTDSFDSITSTADELWVFSPHEVCGDVRWDGEEFRGRRGWQDVDGMLNAEGTQYEAFIREGVTGESDPNGFLSLANSTGKSPWWYRTPYPFDFSSYGGTGSLGYFYQVADSGFPQSLGSPEVPASVVVGFCV